MKALLEEIGPRVCLSYRLRSIGEEHINSNDFDLSVKGFEKNVDVLNEMKNNNFQVIYPSAGQALSTDCGCCGLNPRRSRDNCR